MPVIDNQGPRLFVETVAEPVNEQGTDGLVADPEDYSAGITDYKVTMRYEGHPNIYMMANTVPGEFSSPDVLPFSVSFVQLATQTLLWTVYWTACRWKMKPPIPNPNQPSDSDWVFMGKHLEPGMVGVGPDGVTLIYRISGTYFYGHKNPREDIQDNTNFSCAPWLDNTVPYVQDRVVDGTLYQDNIINIES